MESKPIEPLNLNLSKELKGYMMVMEYCQKYFDNRFEELILKPIRENDNPLTP